MNLTPTHRRVTLLVLVAMAAFGSGGLVGMRTVEPEIVTISEDVPSACTQAVQSAAESIQAAENVEHYETQAQVLSGQITLSVVAGDAEKMEKALAPVEQHNVKEQEWRDTRDNARAAFEPAADDCLAKSAAADALADR